MTESQSTVVRWVLAPLAAFAAVIAAIIVGTAAWKVSGASIIRLVFAAEYGAPIWGMLAAAYTAPRRHWKLALLIFAGIFVAGITAGIIVDMIQNKLSIKDYGGFVFVVLGVAVTLAFGWNKRSDRLMILKVLSVVQFLIAIT